MKTIVYMELIFFLIGYVYLNLINGAASLENLKDDCIFGVKSVAVVLYDKKYPYGEEFGIKDVCNIDASKPVYFFVHGFTSYPNNTDAYKLIRQLSKRNTVFSLDWTQAACTNGIPLVKLLEYPSAVTNTREVGKFMASYVIKLIKECKVPEKNIKFIGHSLGAHVSSFAAKHVFLTLDVKIPYIIGAEPAGPLFSLNSCSERFCKSDAYNVLALHTSPLGIQHPIGTTDLYFNNGLEQPGCHVLDINCSHTKVVDYLYLILEYIGYGYSGVTKTLFSKPSNSTTTDCIFVNGTILERNYIKEGQYDIFTDKKYPYCVKNTFGCNKYYK